MAISTFRSTPLSAGPLLGLALTLALVRCTVPAHAAEGVPIAGTMLDEAGAPIEGAEVTLHRVLPTPDRMALELEGEARPEAEARATTGADGRFRIDAPSAGFWTVVARSEGRAVLALRLDPLVAPPAGASARSVELPPATLPTSTELFVRVADERTTGLSGALIYAWTDGVSERLPGGWAPARQVTVTDADGRARVSLAAGGSLRIQALAGPRAGGTQNAEAPDGGTYELLLAPETTRRMRVARSDGSPVEGALVWWFGGPLGRTDSGGWIELPAPVSRRGWIHVAAAGGRASIPVQPANGGADPTLYATLQAPLALAGHVTERHDRRPLAGALVWPSDDPGAAVRTGPDGSFVLDVAAGRPLVELRAAASGFTPIRRRIEPEDEAGSAGLQLDLAPAAWIPGSVVDSEGRPVAAVQVLARPLPVSGRDPETASRTAWTGPDGRFLLDGLDPSVSYRVVGIHEGHAPAIVEAPPATVGPDRRPVPPAAIRLVLAGSRSLTGRVADAARTPVTGAEVTLLREDQLDDANLWVSVPHFTRPTGPEGRFEFRNPLPGRYVLAILAPEKAPLFRSGVEVPERAGATDLGDLVLEPEAVVRGRVVDARGKPVAGAEVREAVASTPAFLREVLFRRREQQAPEVTGEDGAFVLDRFAAGEPVRVEVSGEGLAPTEVWAVAGQAGEAVEIEARPVARISGTVRDPEGRPVPGAAVAPATERSGCTWFRWVKADAAGRFLIGDAGPGTLCLRGDARGYAASEVTVVELAPGQRLEGVEIALRQGFVLAGRILDAAGQPVQGAEVSAYPGSRVDTTDSQGRFSIEERPRGPVTLTIRRPDLPPLEREVELVPGREPVEIRIPADG